MNKIMLSAVLLLAFAPLSRAAEAPVKMETRMYHDISHVRDVCLEGSGKEASRGPSMGESTRDLAELVDYRKSKASSALRKHLENYGIKFSGEAYAFYDPSWSAMVMRNTPAQHAKLRRLLVLWQCLPNQIALDAAVVAFPRTETEPVARKNASAVPASTDLIAMWKSGKGRLVANQTVITRSGVNAQMQSVHESIHPTEFSSAVEFTNQAPPISLFPVMPGSFETREVGFIFNCTPTLCSDGKTIDLTIAPELSILVGTNSFAAIFGTTGLVTQSRAEQPVFQTGKVTSSLVLRDGATAVMGDLDVPVATEAWYLFLTARVLDSTCAPMGDTDFSILLDDEPAAP